MITRKQTRFFFDTNRKLFKKLSLLIFLFCLGLVSFFSFKYWQEQQDLISQINQLSQTNTSLTQELTTTTQNLQKLENEDQKVINDQLEEKQKQIEKSYAQSVSLYERMLDLDEKGVNISKIQAELAKTFSLLSKSDLDQANQSLTTLAKLIADEEEKIKIKTALAVPTTTVTSTQAPGSGYARQNVETEIGTFVVSLVAGDLATTRVIVDTASGGDCGNDCPVLSVSDYVSRNGGYAGINGSYFCPASYPTCAGKTNTFDLLAMNKDKVYLNSDNNVYSNNPGVIFGSGYIRFVSAVSQWGRDTGIDGMLSNYPLLVSGGEIRFAGDGDPKKGSKGNRSFVANKGNTVYIGVVHGATVAESAWALKTLGMENGLNLDDGGSTALWSGGYKVGPGRNIPNAIVFVRK